MSTSFNIGAVFRGFGWLLQYFFNPDDRQKKLRVLADEALLFARYCGAYPRLGYLEDAAVEVGKAYGTDLTKDPKTGHVETIPVPVLPPAPDRQSPGSFFNDPRNRGEG